jgi:hypothetical protein
MLLISISIYSVYAASRVSEVTWQLVQWQLNPGPSLRVWIEAKPHKASVDHLTDFDTVSYQEMGS